MLFLVFAPKTIYAPNHPVKMYSQRIEVLLHERVSSSTVHKIKGGKRMYKWKKIKVGNDKLAEVDDWELAFFSNMVKSKLRKES